MDGRMMKHHGVDMLVNNNERQFVERMLIPALALLSDRIDWNLSAIVRDDPINPGKQALSIEAMRK
jgi:hypothetical protein